MPFEGNRKEDKKGSLASFGEKKVREESVWNTLLDSSSMDGWMEEGDSCWRG